MTEQASARGMLLRASHWMVVLAPSLTTDEREMDDMLDIVEASLGEVLEDSRLSTVRAVGA